MITGYKSPVSTETADGPAGPGAGCYYGSTDPLADAAKDIGMAGRDVIIIGGGPAGLAAAIALYRLGWRDILIIEREKEPGGILRQCIHDGFGLFRYRQSLSGPEYATRFIDEAQSLGIECLTDTSVLSISAGNGADHIAGHTVTAASRQGLHIWQARAVILAMGCRERTREAIRIPGSRPAGVFTAGVAQAYLNLKNIMVGRRVVILGSGDIGLIMARRMTLEGAQVLAVFEILPYPSGLPRNIEQCLRDYDIPLYLSHTVTEIHGKARLEAVTVSRVDDGGNPLPGSSRQIACDTLIVSVGLIPENELSLQAGIVLDPRTRGPLVDEFYQTSVSGIFAAGNVLQVHDVVDYVSVEAEKLVAAVGRYLDQARLPLPQIKIEAAAAIGYTVPQAVSGTADFTLCLRARRPLKKCQLLIRQGGQIIKCAPLRKANPAEMIQILVRSSELVSREPLQVTLETVQRMTHYPPADFARQSPAPATASRTLTCILCPLGCDLDVTLDGTDILVLDGAGCPRGRGFVESEVRDPRRIVTTSVKVHDGQLPLASVRLTQPIPLDQIPAAMARLQSISLAAPVHPGQIVDPDLLGLGSAVMVTKRVGRADNR